MLFLGSGSALSVPAGPSLGVEIADEKVKLD
jgi:hypothetical protein